ncbi:hypothetical protein ACLK1Z_16220 [Escherichia coli]
MPLFPRSFVTRGQALGFGKLAAMDVSGAQAMNSEVASTTASGLSAVAALSDDARIL